MPYAPLKPCAYPLCAELVPSGQRHCEAHRKQTVQAYEKSRGNSTARGYDRSWQQAREQALKRDRYICKSCEVEGIITPATQVHHIKPFRQGDKSDPLRLKLDNLESLCASCHAKIDGWSRARHHRQNQQQGSAEYMSFEDMRERERQKSS